jgi:parallel beta-helix repeat protein
MDRRTVATFLIAVAGAAAAAGADTLMVPSDDYPDIQSAVDDAGAGDTILVARGDYVETVSINEKSGITLRGKGFPTIRPGAAVGIDISESQDIVISGFVVDQCTTGVEVSTSDRVSISRMIVTGTTGNAFGLLDNAVVLISKCEVDGTGGQGVDDNSSDDVTVEKCKFQGITGLAVRLSSSNPQGDASDRALVSKNRISGAGGGLHLGGEDIVVEKNRIELGSGFGIFFDGSSSPSRAVVTKNVVSTAGNPGIYVSGGGFDITRNRLTGGGIQDSGGGSLIDRNAVTGANYGIYFNGSGATVTNNTLRDSGTAGIYLGGWFLPVTGNRVFGGADVGIHVNTTGDGPVAGNRVTESGGTGILVNGSGNTLTGNAVAGAGSFGIFVTGTSNTFSANRASGSASFDLADTNAGGVNTYAEDNRFGTSQIPYGD